MSLRHVLVLAASLALAGCSSDGASAPASAPAPPPPPAPSAGAPAAPAPPAPPGMPGVPNPLAAMNALAEAAKQVGQAQPTGPVVNWRDLAPFLRDEVAGFKAEGDVDGRTTSMQGMQVTEVSRRYKRGDEDMKIEILDTSWAPFLRAPFAFVQMVQEDSSKGYKKGISFKGHPAIAEWRKDRSSELHALVGQRFLINVDIETKTMGLAEQVAQALDVDAIVATSAKAQAQAAMPGAPAPAAPAK